ncbi:MAG: hypothetical protein Q4D16_23755 [Eubacteriales bacterium]|nr:hypothetical protein [Eubacteriales bacterium]
MIEKLTRKHLKYHSKGATVVFKVLCCAIIALVPFAVELKANTFETSSVVEKRYTLVDDLFNPDDFSEFRNDPENINVLMKFYNEILGNEKFKILNAFAQPIVIDEFKGDKRFYYGSEEFIKSMKKEDRMINAIQLNQNAFDNYNLNLKEGELPIWETISYEKDIIPVLLGADYNGIYEVGNTINADYYNKSFKLEVVGILKKDSNINYKGNPKLALDNYIVIPYPEKLWTVDEDDFIFESILYFAMINCDIATALDEETFIQEMKEIEANIGFNNFFIVNADGSKLTKDLLVN